MKNIAIIGYGRVGKAIKYYLEELCPVDYHVTTFDTNVMAGADVVMLGKLTRTEAIEYYLDQQDAVVCATPYNMNTLIATAALNKGIAYFDLTEDTAIAREIGQMTVDRMGSSVVVPQCGLAPGAVSIIAAQLANTMDVVKDVNLRVGALPMTANNKIKYYLTWSSEGLINEYCNSCDAVVNGQHTTVQPLEGLEDVVIDGDEYEAFNTSGGIGSLIQTLENDQKQCQNINYKTIRYKGHRDLMRFLLDDLGFRSEKQALVEIFNRQVPQAHRDVVVIFVQVTGIRNGQLATEMYVKKIYGYDKFTAIQRTTAMGLCTVVHHWATGGFKAGLYTPESISPVELAQNPFWQLYHC